MSWTYTIMCGRFWSNIAHSKLKLHKMIAHSQVALATYICFALLAASYYICGYLGKKIRFSSGYYFAHKYMAVFTIATTFLSSYVVRVLASADEYGYEHNELYYFHVVSATLFALNMITLLVVNGRSNPAIHKKFVKVSAVLIILTITSGVIFINAYTKKKVTSSVNYVEPGIFCLIFTAFFDRIAPSAQTCLWPKKEERFGSSSAVERPPVGISTFGIIYLCQIIGNMPIDEKHSSKLLQSDAGR